MFVYKFMFGRLADATGDEEAGVDGEAGGFDPHEHRKVEKPCTYGETMSHMLKGSVGAGILAMPDAVTRLGLISSVVGIAAIGIFATYCIHMLIAGQYELCKRLHRGYLSYPKSMRLAVQGGPPCLRWSAHCWPWFVDVVLVLWQLGLCCVYSVFVAENLKQVLDIHGMPASVRMHLLVLLLPLVVVGLVKDLKLLAPMSSVSNVVTVAGLLIVFWYLMEDDVDVTTDCLYIKRLVDVPFFIGTTLFALEAVGVILALEYNMERPKRFVGLFGLFNVGMLIIVVLYMLVGVFGSLKYGDSVQASITLNLPMHDKKAQAAKVMMALAIFLSFPLQNFVAYKIVWLRCRKRLDPSRHCFIDYVLRVFLVVLPWLLAVAVPKLGPFISLFGALCLSLLAIILPAIMDLCLWFPVKNGYGICSWKLIRDVLIVIIGALCLCSGVYTSLLEMGHGDEPDAAPSRALARYHPLDYDQGDYHITE